MMEFWGHITTFFSAENYTLFVVGIGSGVLCFASGVVGTFTYLRKRALIGDVIPLCIAWGCNCFYVNWS